MGAFVRRGAISCFMQQIRDLMFKGMASSSPASEREQRAVRVTQHHALHGCVERRLAQYAGRDTQPLIEIDDAITDRRLAGESCRYRVNHGLRVELAAARELHPFDLAAPVVGTERLRRKRQTARCPSTRRDKTSFRERVPERLGEGGHPGRPRSARATSRNGRLMPQPPGYGPARRCSCRARSRRRQDGRCAPVARRRDGRPLPQLNMVSRPVT